MRNICGRHAGIYAGYCTRTMWLSYKGYSGYQTRICSGYHRGIYLVIIQEIFSGYTYGTYMLVIIQEIRRICNGYHVGIVSGYRTGVWWLAYETQLDMYSSCVYVKCLDMSGILCNTFLSKFHQTETQSKLAQLEYLQSNSEQSQRLAVVK